jgi:UDP-N-acetylbacillosamine N-acetyltransferase
MKTIAIYGASGHGKVVADIALCSGFEKLIFIDDGDNDFINFEYFIVKYKNNIPISLGIGDNFVRFKLYKKCKENNLKILTLVHPSSVIAKDVIIEEGSVIMANVVINTGTKIGKGTILNTGSVVEHDNMIGDFVHISPSSVTAGNVTIGDFTHFGIGSCVKQGIVIGKNSIIGAGSVVLKNIDDNVMAFGNPCKIVKELKH